MKASWPFLTILPCLCFGAGWSIDGDRGIAMKSPRGVGDHFEMSAVKTVEVVALSRREEGTGVFGRTVCGGFSVGDGCFRLAPGAFLRYARCVAGRAENDPCYYPDVEAERAARLTLWREASDMLVLETPSPEIDALFRFAKFRTLESLYATRAGLVHSPGGVHYLAAIWANDQAEYACPLLAYLGHPSAKEATKTCLRWFAQRMNDGYRPIPSSIIAENRSFWNGAGDRGDQAMMAHGAARTALSLGDAAFALCDEVSRGGNLLLNIGPTGRCRSLAATAQSPGRRRDETLKSKRRFSAWARRRANMRWCSGLLSCPRAGLLAACGWTRAGPLPFRA